MTPNPREEFRKAAELLEREGVKVVQLDAPVEAFQLDPRATVGFSSTAIRATERLGQLCQAYLNSPMILDDFGTNHSARRAWRLAMAVKYGEEVWVLVRSDNLRANNINGVLRWLDTLTQALKQSQVHAVVAERIIGLAAHAPRITGEQYVQMSQEKKVAHIRQVRQSARALLAVLEK